MNFLPDIYSLFYYAVLVLAVLLVYVDANTDLFIRYKNYFKYFQYFFVCFCILLIGFRPVGDDGYFDTQMYMDMFNYAKEHHELKNFRDIGFDYFTIFTSYFMNYRGFFVLCSFLSFTILFYTGKLIDKRNWFLFFLATCSSLYFFDYQVYTIRQGLGAAFLLLAFVCNNKYFRIFLLVLSVLFHKSLLLPVVGYFVCSILYNGNLFYLIIWFLSVPISYFSGHWWENFFAKFLLKSDSRTAYLTDYFNDPIGLSRSGFRWDIILYSFIFVLVGIFNLKYINKEDKKYQTIFNVYLITSSVVILIIRANNIHRFAYLAWFLIPVLLFYPLLIDNKNFKYKLVSKLLVIVCTFLMIYKIVKL